MRQQLLKAVAHHNALTLQIDGSLEPNLKSFPVSWQGSRLLLHYLRCTSTTAAGMR